MHADQNIACSPSVLKCCLDEHVKQIKEHIFLVIEDFVKPLDKARSQLEFRTMIVWDLALVQFLQAILQQYYQKNSIVGKPIQVLLAQPVSSMTSTREPTKIDSIASISIHAYVIMQANAIQVDMVKTTEVP